jgi:hypothetical protein
MKRDLSCSDAPRPTKDGTRALILRDIKVLHTILDYVWPAWHGDDDDV